MMLYIISWICLLLILPIILLKFSRKFQWLLQIFLAKFIFYYHIILPTKNQLISEEAPQILLMLGSRKAATNYSLLQKFNIHYVLSVGENFANFKYPAHMQIKHKKILAQDIPSYPIKDDIIEAVHFIKKGFRNNRGVLVHCQAGISRSSTIVIAFLMIQYKLKLLDAFKLVQEKRVYIAPNSGFIKQLIAFEKFLEKCKYYNNQIIQ